jgi:hypothetical protein
MSCGVYKTLCQWPGFVFGDGVPTIQKQPPFSLRNSLQGRHPFRPQNRKVGQGFARHCLEGAVP